MKPYATAAIALLMLIMLFSLQLCLFSYQQHSQFNPALIAYIYILMTNCSMTLLTCLAVILDATNYLISGTFGLSILFLVPASQLTLIIKKNMYNKVIIPCFFIFLYTIFYNIILKLYLLQPVQINQIFFGIIQNCFIFLIVWKITKQPFHD